MENDKFNRSLCHTSLQAIDHLIRVWRQHANVAFGSLVHNFDLSLATLLADLVEQLLESPAALVITTN